MVATWAGIDPATPIVGRIVLLDPSKFITLKKGLRHLVAKSKRPGGDLKDDITDVVSKIKKKIEKWRYEGQCPRTPGVNIGQ